MTKLLFAILILAITPGRAALLAHFNTSRGTVTVELQHATAPQAVANFMTLAQGTRAWLDSSGAVKTDRYYDGTKIHRVVNNTSSKIAQGGSRKGDGSDGAGYLFRDEFAGGLTHVPYVMSSANFGTNTNSAQFFFTGSLSQPGYNNVHTIMGLVTQPASRAVVDDIILAGANATTINSISFERTDPTAVAFNELAQGLPEISAVPCSLTAIPGGAVTITPRTPLPPWTELQAFKSSNFVTWESSSYHHVGGSAPALATAVIEQKAEAKRFFNISKCRYPDDQTVSAMTSATFTSQTPGLKLVYAFDATGRAGTVTITSDGSPTESGPFLLESLSSAPYKLVIVIDHQNALNPRYLRFTANSEQFTPGKSTGRETVEYFHSVFGWQLLGYGTQSLVH